MPGGVRTGFPDVFATVPQLLESCLEYDSAQHAEIRLLRLVSKDVGCAALTAVTRCALQLGERAPLQPQTVVRLLSSAQLESLSVTLIVTSGAAAYVSSNLHDIASYAA